MLDSSLLVVLTGLGTVAYAVWRLVSGHFVINLTVGIDLQRMPNKIDPTKHDLVVNTKLKKGNQSTLTLTSLQVRVSSQGCDLFVHEVDDIHVAQCRDLNLSPGEETQFASWCQVPSEATCFVQVAVSGRTFQPPVLIWLGRWVPRSVQSTFFVPSEAHWRATAFSLPYLKDRPGKEASLETEEKPEKAGRTLSRS